MVRERVPARKPPKAGEISWIVEDDLGSEDEEYHSSASRRTSTKQEPSEVPGSRTSTQNDSSRTRTTSQSVPEEDIDFSKPTISNLRSVSSGSFGDDVNSTIRKRVHANQPCGSRKPYRLKRRPDLFNVTWQDRVEATFEYIYHAFYPIIEGFFEVLALALRLCKKPLGFVLAIYFLAGLMVFLYNLASTSISQAVSPICRLPGARLLSLPICRYDRYSKGAAGGEAPPVEFDQVMTVQSKFEEVLQEAASGVGLPVDMKRGETSIRDLRQLVRFSQLRSRNELVLEFDSFIETARLASYDLQKFNSHIGRGVDNVLATALWTKRVLDGIAERDSSRGMIVGFVSDKILAPFQPLRLTEDAVFDQYLQHTRTVEDEISRLVAEAQALLLMLQNLEDRLDIIHGIAVRDNLHVEGSKGEVLSQLWTMLGGNRGKLGKFESQLRLLTEVNKCRQSAIAHVSGTMLKLQSMGAEMEELRDRVGSVELLGKKGPLPLRMHIENIEMGVERLERSRMSAKELETEQLKRNLGRGPDSKDHFIDAR